MGLESIMKNTRFEAGSAENIIRYRVKEPIVCGEDYIDKHYGEMLDLEQLAKRVYLTPGHLSKIFKKETGVSLIQYIKNVRVIRQIKRCRFRQIKTGLSEHLTMG